MLLHHKLINRNLILASQSPRRQQLLRELGLEFEVRLGPEVEETFPDDLPYGDIPTYLAQKKAEPFTPTLTPNDVLITSDTIVWANGTVLGKPANRTEAARMLDQLSGRMHVVVTGVTLSSHNRSHSFAAHTNVFFRDLTPEEIEYYVHRYSPLDKAGAYGIQEWIGYVGVERIEGSFHNVMGLPVQRLYVELDSFLL